MKIRRLSARLRHSAGLNRDAARGMHVVNERSINGRVPNQEYSIPQKNGHIRRITLYEQFLKEEILEKVADGYKVIKSRFVK